MVQAKLDEWGKPAWIAVAVFAFTVGWPFGLAVLAFLIGSGRLRPGGFRMPGAWSNLRHSPAGTAWRGWTGGSGNAAFDEYRAETIRRLEEEQKEFESFLVHLRQARDKAEFDQFMADRRRRPEGGEAQAST